MSELNKAATTVKRVFSNLWVVGIGILVLLFLFLKPFAIVKDTEVAVESTWNGKVVEKPITQGFQFKNPFNTYTFYPMTYQVLTLDNVAIPAQDGFKTIFNLTITGTFINHLTPNIQRDAGSPEAFYQKQVIPLLQSELNKSSLRYAIDSKNYFNGDKGKEIATLKEGEIKQPLFIKVSDDAIANTNKRLEPLGFHIRSIEATKTVLADEVMSVVIKNKQKEEMTIGQAAQLEIAALKAQEKEKLANSTANATRTTADAEKYEAEMRADAKLYTANKEALANKELAESITPSLINYMNAQAKMKWDGKLPETVVGESTPMIMSLDKSK